MHTFDYARASSSEEAVQALKAGEEAKFLAGGMTLLPSLKLRLAAPTHLVDLGRIPELAGITVTGNTVKVGAMTRHADVAGSADVQKSIPALAHLAEGIGDAQVRNRGTIGGSLANSDPAADYPAAVLGLGATIETDRRQIAADDFFLDIFETALEEDELIKAVHFPMPKRAGYAKFPNPASRYAVVGVMVAETDSGVRVAVTGAGPCAFRVPAMEQELAKDFAPEAIAGIKISEDELNSDLHASAAYRAHLVTVMAKRAVAAARG
jgi:carbon-monoxide dehydrogenase medium subunit